VNQERVLILDLTECKWRRKQKTFLWNQWLHTSNVA